MEQVQSRANVYIGALPHDGWAKIGLSCGCAHDDGCGRRLPLEFALDGKGRAVGCCWGLLAGSNASIRRWTPCGGWTQSLWHMRL